MPRRAVLAFVIVLAAAGAVWVWQTAGARPEMSLEARTVDFGPLSERSTRSIELRNTGRKPLYILAISSSCGCTTAVANATVLAPGATARLAITFDPVAHGPQAGPARHAVYLRTNDARTPEVEVEVRAVVLKAGAR